MKNKQVKFIHNFGYPSLDGCINKTVPVMHDDEVTLTISGAELLKAGADPQYIKAEWSYCFTKGCRDAMGVGFEFME